jgi:hypothetical protein
MHDVAHVGGVWLTAPVQKVGRYNPQSSARVVAVQAESSATPITVTQLEVTH